jgi:parvulin-like peptidyl-prolyl isomerase
MRPRYLTSLLLLLAFVVAGCGDRGSPRLSSNDVAAAGELRLSVDEAADILLQAQGLPNDADVVRALAEFWADYTLLALAVNREGELERMDLSSILEPQEKQSLVMLLRNDVIDDELEISDEEVDRYYEEDRPGEEVRARHILLMWPADATMAQEDSVRAQATQLRDRARAGANFASLATEYSEDPGSAARGGDLDYFPRGMMVEPFEEAAFSLPVGEVSDLVETQYGVHIIRVEDRRRPSLDEIRDELREMMRQERVMVAESIFVADARDAAGIEIEAGAPGLMREAARAHETGLSGRAAGQTLATWDGGRFTAGEFLEFLETQAPGLIPQIDGAADGDLRGLLENLVQSEVLVAEARRRGLQVDPDETRETVEAILAQYRQLAETIGVDGIEPEDGESLTRAIDRRVKAIMNEVVRGDIDIFPLQQLALPLRSHFGYRIGDAGVERTVERVEARRGEGGMEEFEFPDGMESFELPDLDFPDPDGDTPDADAPDAPDA